MRKRLFLLLPLLAGCPMAGVRSISTSVISDGNAIIPYSSVGNSLANLTAIDRYYPIKRTYTWTYQVTIKDASGNKTVSDVMRIESVSGDTIDKSATYTTTRKEGNTLLALENGTLTQTSTSLTISGDGGTEVINLPLTSGTNWISGGLDARCYSVGNLTVQGKAYQDVMAIAYTKDGETKAVRWLAPGIGIIKQLSRITVNGAATEVTSELQQAQLSAVTSVSLLPATVSLAVGATASLNAHVSYDDGSIGKEYTLVSADRNIAWINSSGYLEGMGTGTTSVTAISQQDSSKFATMSVVIVP